MSSVIKHLNEDSDFAAELRSCGDKLAVVDFYADWCGPCRAIAPKYAELSLKYPDVAFFKVDVDNCQEIAMSQGVRAMPTFIFYRNGDKVDTMTGANAQLLEEKIVQHSGKTSSGGSDVPKDFQDCLPFISQIDSECLNESDAHTFDRIFKNDNFYLESDCDAELLLSLAFSQVIKLKGIRFYAPAANGPKKVRLFINQNSISFDDAKAASATEEFELEPAQLTSGKLVEVRFVRFQNVVRLTIFVESNQSDDEEQVTRIDHVQIIGKAVSTTDMQNFKRVSGDPNESHH